MFSPNGEMHRALKDKEFKHSPFKFVRGACASSFVICDLLNKSDATFASLKYLGKFRILMPNETYYQEYDKQSKDIAVDYSDKDTPFEYSWLVL